MSQIGKITLAENIPLGPKTTIKLGGPARYFTEVGSTEELIAALAQAKHQHLDVHILGGGSNTIFADQGFDGLVIQINLKGVIITEDGQVTAAAGEEWDQLVQQTINAGLSGFECMSGIPGLVGATPMQNVGAYGQDTSQSLVRLEALDRKTTHSVTFSAPECSFEYRGSRFKYQDAGRYIITKVIYQLKPNGRPKVVYAQLIEKLGGAAAVQHLGTGAPALQAVRQAVLELRADKSMVVNSADPNSRSCGSFFVNPILNNMQLDRIRQVAEPPTFKDKQGTKVPAAWLIEQSGFTKGYRQGGVGISANHPLALVNYGGTTTELLELAADIQGKVAELFGVSLKREPVIVE